VKSQRFRRIVEENIKFEKKSPYNFCDRWCERCPPDKQTRCRLYQDEFERKLTCIAHGRDLYDPEITAEVMEQQFEDSGKKIKKFMEENDIDFDDSDDSESANMGDDIEPAENNPLDNTGEQFCKRADEFLKEVFYNKEGLNPDLTNDFETIAWYHTLLSVKLHRALCGLHEFVNQDEFPLCDAVAQFAICKKAITGTVQALRRIAPDYFQYKNLIQELLALLHNILSRIEALEESI